MRDFVHMMLMSPIAALLINFLGIPVEATALLGMIVPMFLMQRISGEEANI